MGIGVEVIPPPPKASKRVYHPPIWGKTVFSEKKAYFLLKIQNFRLFLKGPS